MKKTNRVEEQKISCGVCPYITGCVDNANNGKAGCQLYGKKRKKESRNDSNS